MREKLLAGLRAALLVVWVAAIVILMQFLAGWLLLFILGRETFGLPVWQAVYSVLAYVTAFLVLEFLTPVLENLLRKWRKFKDLAKWRWASRKELGLTGLPTWLDIVFGVLGYITVILLSNGVTAIFKNFTWFDAEQSQELIFSPYVGGADRIIAFVSLALVAPIAEELIFRGWLYGKLRKILGKKMKKWGAIVLSILMVSVLFGILHGQWNVGITVFVLSVVACILREMTGTIYAGTLIHIIQNGIAFYLLYVVGMV